jgi:hypothetical protein
MEVGSIANLSGDKFATVIAEFGAAVASLL